MAWSRKTEIYWQRFRGHEFEINPNVEIFKFSILFVICFSGYLVIQHPTTRPLLLFVASASGFCVVSLLLFKIKRV